MENWLLKLKIKRMLFNEIKRFSQQEQEIITKAYKFAEKLHKGQSFDGSKYDYFIHPLYAGYLLARWKRNYEEVCAGILHDVVEDCGVNIHKIKDMFNQRIVFLVDGMSWEIKWDKKEKRYIKDRIGFYKKIYDYSIQDVGLVIVHASDELSKVGDIIGESLRKLNEPEDKTKKRYSFIASYMIPFYSYLGLNKVAENLQKKISLYLSEKQESKMFQLINKKNLDKIKKELNKIKEIDELR